MEDISPFVGPLIPMFWTSGDVSTGFQSQSRQPYLHLVKAYMCYIFPEIYFSWDTCQPLGGQADLFYILASRHWWGSKLVPIMPQTNAPPSELWRLGYCFLSLCRIVFLCCHWYASMISDNVWPGFLLWWTYYLYYYLLYIIIYLWPLRKPTSHKDWSGIHANYQLQKKNYSTKQYIFNEYMGSKV